MQNYLGYKSATDCGISSYFYFPLTSLFEPHFCVMGWNSHYLAMINHNAVKIAQVGRQLIHLFMRPQKDNIERRFYSTTTI